MSESEAEAIKPRSFILELPLELRENIYDFLITDNALITSFSNPPCLWELRCSHYPDPTPLHINRQITTEYTPFIRRLFNKSKLLVSTNALTSPLPPQFVSPRALEFYKRVPYVVVQTLSDSKWWISFMRAPWPLHFVQQLLPFLCNCSTLELICRLVGDYMFFPQSHLQNFAVSAENLRSFSQYQVPKHHPVSQNITWMLGREVTVVKTLILEPRPFERIHGDIPGIIQLVGMGSHDAVFRSIVNSGGARFSEDPDWFQKAERELEPLLAQRSRAFGPKLRWADERESDIVSRAAVYSLTERME